MTENKSLLDLLNEEIENAKSMHQYYRELSAKYQGKFEALEDLRLNLNQKEEEEEEEEEEEKKGE